MAARGEDIEWAIKILAEAKDRLKGQTASQERAAPGNAASRRGTVDGKSLRDLERENARLRAELHMLRQNLETPGDEQVKGEAGVVRMRRHTSCKLSEAVTETIFKDGVDGSVAGPGEPELRGRDGTVVRLPRPRAKAECKLVVCTDRHGCEFIRPGPRGIRTSQHSTNQVKLVWDEQPRRALIVKKPHDADSRGALVCIARYLVVRGRLLLGLSPPLIPHPCPRHRTTASPSWWSRWWPTTSAPPRPPGILRWRRGARGRTRRSTAW